MGHGGGDRISPSLVQGEKPQNRPLSKLNTGRLALRAMLPVKTTCTNFCTYYLWPQLSPPCNTLCTSGFVDDVTLSHNGINTDTGHWRNIHPDSPGGARSEVCSTQLPLPACSYIICCKEMFHTK